MIREVGESLGRAVLDGLGRATGNVQKRKPLPVDLLESDDAYLAVFDAPDATAEGVGVSFAGNTVEIQIDRNGRGYDGFEMRFPGRGRSLSGSVELPEDAAVDPEAATAVVTERGTVEVRIPKDDPDDPDA